jgi:hypothetical protein
VARSDGAAAVGALGAARGCGRGRSDSDRSITGGREGSTSAGVGTTGAAVGAAGETLGGRRSGGDRSTRTAITGDADGATKLPGAAPGRNVRRAT